MKIATWNLERPTKTSNKIAAIEKCIASLNADILILTETNECINPGPGYSSYHSAPLAGLPVPLADVSFKQNPKNISLATTAQITYKPGERRTSIYSKYKFIEQLPTFNNETSICIKFETPRGELAVYGTIIGILGNREPGFQSDLDDQLKDFETVATKTNLCIAGDLNITFADNSYFTGVGRDKLNESFKSLELENMTGFIPGNIDHIILPGGFIGKKRDLEIWNTGKTMSDHIGVAVTIS